MVIGNKLRGAFRLARCATELLRHIGKRKLIVDLPMAGELPYILPILKNAKELSGMRLILVPANDHEFNDPLVAQSLGPIAKNFFVMQRQDVKRLSRWFRFDGLITSEQFSEPLVRPAICIFHGQPSKGLTFSQPSIEQFDHYFHLGPLHRRALAEYVSSHQVNSQTLPQSHEIGFPKSDELIGGSSPAEASSLDDRMGKYEKTILYAPAFNEHCTLRSIGLSLVETLAAVPNAGVIVKLAPDSIGRLDNFYATGGVDWREQIEALDLENVVVATDLDINPSMVRSDIMVTDVSGVGYEFLALGKPVVYFECLDFYQEIVDREQEWLSLEMLISRDTMNGGRNYGTVVRSLDELAEVLSNPLVTPNRTDMQRLLLYNSGNSTTAMFQKLAELFAT